MDFFRPFRENKRHERARRVERGRKREEEAEDNLPMEPAGCGENRVASLRAGRRGSGKRRDVLEMENKGRRAALGRQAPEQDSEGEGRHSLSSASHALFLAGNISSSLKPFSVDKALSDAFPHPLIRVSFYLPPTCQERRPVSLRGSQANLEPVKPPAAKEGEFLSFYRQRKEIVLLKIQEKICNIVNSLEVQIVFPTQSKS